MATSAQLAPAPDELLVPVTLELSPIRRLLVIDITGDPVYRTLEPQVLEGPGGDEVVLLAYRRDGHVELYAPSGSDVDPAGYEGLGKGLLGIHRGPFEAARFEVTQAGLQLDLTVAADGHRFDLHIHEHLAGPRDGFALLAPVGGAFDAPAFFPFLWLPGLSFVRVRGTVVDVRVDGEVRHVARLPLPVAGRRCLMARYDPDVMVCQVNPDSVRVPPRVPAHEHRGTEGPGVDIAEVDGGCSIVAVRVARGERTCTASFEPPLPDVRALPAGTRRSGEILLQADGTTELRGRYEVDAEEDRIDLTVEDFGPWRTRVRRPPLALLFRLPIFRRWPTTYRWRATLDSRTAGARMTSGWERCPPSPSRARPRR